MFKHIKAISEQCGISPEEYKEKGGHGPLALIL